MKVNIDGSRRTVTASMNKLGYALKSALEDVSESNREQVVEAFDQAASHINILNCIYDDDNPTFNDISGGVWVVGLGGGE